MSDAVRKLADWRQGALSLYILYPISERSGIGYPEKQGQANQPLVSSYLSTKSPISRGWDTIEAQTLGQAFDAIMQQKIEKALDIIPGRLLSLETSTRHKGDFKIASKWEVLETTTGTLGSA